MANQLGMQSIPKHPAPTAPVDFGRPPQRAPSRSGMICPNPNCGYVGDPKKKARGSVIMAILLFFLPIVPAFLYVIFLRGTETGAVMILLYFLLPCILYAIFMRGHRYSCPACKLQIANDN